jgi:hypothetical protein
MKEETSKEYKIKRLRDKLKCSICKPNRGCNSKHGKNSGKKNKRKQLK